jgi:hypothetical protein
MLSKRGMRVYGACMSVHRILFGFFTNQIAIHSLLNMTQSQLEVVFNRTMLTWSMLDVHLPDLSLLAPRVERACSSCAAG